MAAPTPVRTRWSGTRLEGGRRIGIAIFAALSIAAITFSGAAIAAPFPPRAPLATPRVASAPPLNWTLVRSGGPPPRTEAAIVYDPVDGYTLLFGGAKSLNGSGYPLNDTWEFSSGKWKQLHPSISPSPRWAAAATWDPSAKAVLLFGGMTNNSSAGYLDSVGGTWEFVHGTWTQIVTPPNATPSGRAYAGFAFDKALGVAVLFGGEWWNGITGGYGTFGDTWEFANATWKLVTGSGPAARAFGQMAYDSASSQVVLFSGFTASGGLPADTWVFTAHGWSSLSLTTHPPAISQGSLTFDPRAGGLILYGGAMGVPLAGVFQNGTWEFKAGNWTELTSPGPTLDLPCLVYNSHSGRLLMMDVYQNWTGTGLGPPVEQVWVLA